MSRIPIGSLKSCLSRNPQRACQHLCQPRTSLALCCFSQAQRRGFRSQHRQCLSRSSAGSGVDQDGPNEVRSCRHEYGSAANSTQPEAVGAGEPNPASAPAEQSLADASLKRRQLLPYRVRHPELMIQDSHKDQWPQLYRKLLLTEEHPDYGTSRTELDELGRFAKEFLSSDSDAAVRAKLYKMGLDWCADNVALLLAGSLFYSAELGLTTLRAIDPFMPNGSRIPVARSWITVCDALRYLDTRWGDQIRNGDNRELRTMFARLIYKLSDARNIPSGNIKIPRLLLLLDHNPPETGDWILERALKDRDDSSDTVLAALEHYASRKDHTRALSLLQRLPLDLRQSPTVVLNRACMCLLHSDTIETSESGQNFTILPRLIEAGIPISNHMHNLVIENAVSARAPTVAWEIFRHMRSQQMDVDPRRHLVLLRDAFLRSDIDALNEIMSIIYARDDLVREKFLVAYMMNIVRSVSYYERKLSSDSCMEHILTIYDRTYDRSPLVKLGLVGPLLEDAGLSSSSSSSPPLPLKPLPDPSALGFSVWAMILVQHEPQVVSRLWDRFLELVKAGDPEITQLAKWPVVYHGMIIFSSRREETLPTCLDVVQTMIELDLAAPTPMTWNKLLCSFLLHKREDVAVQIRQMMERRNVTMAERDWTVLFDRFGDSGFAKEIRRSLDEKAIPEEMGLELGFEEGDLAEHGEAESARGEEEKEDVKPHWDRLASLSTSMGQGGKLGGAV